MCGRFALHTFPRDFLRSLKVDDLPLFEARYNVAPTTQCPVVVADEGDRRAVAMMRWGLVPSWAKDVSIGNRMINARCETVAEKPAYKRAFRDRRCIVPANGFYEWKKLRSRKQPYFLFDAAGELLRIAGLWENWTDRETGEHIQSFTILTRTAEGVACEVHDRMPVALDAQQAENWLNPTLRDPAALCDMVQGPPRITLASYPVDQAVNRPQNDGPALIERVSLAENS